ncbi:MAG: hypothetical protein ACXVC0_09980 [Bdellovibrionota bacterium]
MGYKSSPTEIEIYRRVDEVLHYLWDPIGVSDSPEARDEYQGYLPKIYAMIMEKKPHEEILKYMKWAVGDHMGLPVNTEKNLEIIKILEKYRDIYLDRESRMKS